MRKIISYSKLLENTCLSNTTIAQDLPILLKAFNYLFEFPLQLSIDNTGIRFRIISPQKKLHSFALIFDSPDQQLCCGYFLRDEFLGTLHVSLDTANHLSIGLKYVQDFLTKLDYEFIHQGPLTHNPPPILLHPNDRIIYFFDNEPNHCALITSINPETNQPIISHKFGSSSPEIQSWSELFNKHYKPHISTIFKNFLTYKIYRKST